MSLHADQDSQYAVSSTAVTRELGMQPFHETAVVPHTVRHGTPAVREHGLAGVNRAQLRRSSGASAIANARAFTGSCAECTE